MPRPADPAPRPAWAAGALGLTAGLNQVVLLRELLVLAGGNELCLGLGLAGWLCFSALGSLLVSRLRLTPRSPLAALLAAGSGGILALVLVRLAPALLGFDPGETAGLGRVLLLCLLALAPAGLAAGAAFPLLLAPLPTGQSAPSQSLARLYGLEALGAALAGALFAILLVPALSPLMVVLLAALLSAALAVVLAPPPGRWLALACALLLALGLFQAGAWDRALRQAQWPGRGILALAETPYAQVMATRQAGQTDFYSSGLWFLSQPEGQRRQRLGLLPLLTLPQARSALFIGGAAQGAAVEMARASSVQVTAVEPDPWLLAFVAAHATPGAAPENLHVVQGDGRVFLQRAKGRFDLVVLDLPPPSTVQLNRFYSREGLAAIKRALTPQGVAVLALPGPGESLGRLQARQLGALLAAARESFAQVLPLWGPELMLFCARKEGALAEDPGVWQERLARQDWPQAPAVRDDLLAEGLDPWRRRQLMQALELTGPHAPNRDLHPLALLYDSHLWGTRLGGQGAWAAGLAGLRAWHLGLPLLAIAGLLAWRSRRAQGSASGALGWGVLVAGCTSTAWSLLLIMVWQAAFGSLYLGLALLLGAFMLGMGLAALAAGGLLEALERPESWLCLGHWSLGLGCLATLGVAHWLSILGAPGKGFQMLVLALAVLDGALTGAYFALAGRAGSLRGAAASRGLARLGGGLYGLDLAGGVLGALWPLILVPSLGHDASLSLLALLNLSGLLGLRRSRSGA